MNAPNKYTPKMVAFIKGVSVRCLMDEIYAGRIKTEVWYGETLIDESVVRSMETK